MGATAYIIPTSSGLIEGTAVSDESSLGGLYKGGSLLGWNLYGKIKSKIIFYDNSTEAKGTNYGPITLNEHESIRDWFGSNGIKFKEALYMKVVEGEVEGVVFAAVE
jgi:hypothetical protein